MLPSFLRDHRAFMLLLMFFGLCLRTLAQDCSPFVRDYSRSIVSLSVKQVRQETGAVESGAGTGFIITEEGYVLTAYHVVAQTPGFDELIINGSIGSVVGQSFPLRVVDVMKERDVALLQFKDTTGTYTRIPVGDPWTIQVGEPLCSLSFNSIEDLHPNTGSLGGRSVRHHGLENFWSTEMPSNPGESGAPVFDTTRGGVVALKHGGFKPAELQNINFLIPINLARTLLADYCDITFPSKQQTPGSAMPSTKHSDSSKLKFPIKFRQDDSLGNYHIITEIKISIRGTLGTLEGTTETNNHDEVRTNCGRIAVWLTDKDGDPLMDPLGGYNFCVEGTQVLSGKSVKKETWRLNVPVDILNKAAGIGILQTGYDIDPLELTSENRERVKKALKLFSQ